MLQNVINIEGWDRTNEIGLITAPVAYGKTYFCIHELPKMLDVEPKETLMLFPRKEIRNQSLREYKKSCVEYQSEESGFENKVRLATCHLIGNTYRRTGYMPIPTLVIVDEWHTCFAENNFAFDLLYFQQVFQKWVDNPKIIVVCLTGTPTLPMEFVNQCPFAGLENMYGKMPKMPIRNLTRELKPKFKAGKIIVQQNQSIESVLRAVPASEDNKQIVFVKGSIERLVDLANADEKATWLCSASSNAKIGDAWAKDLMNASHYEQFTAGNMPEGINRIYLSSAYREGLNVYDESIKDVIIDGVTDIDIVQSFGRVRHNTERLIVVVDKRRYQAIESKVKNARQLLESENLTAFEDYYLEQLEQQKDEYEGTKKPILVFKDKANNRLMFNYWALYYWLYERFSAICAGQSNNQSVFWFDRELPSLKGYFEAILGAYSDAPIVYNPYRYIRPATIEQENKERIAMFDWGKWSGKELFGEMAEQFKQEIGLKNKDYSLMAVSGIYKRFPMLFAKKQCRRIDGNRINTYTLKNGSDLLTDFI